ncbi:MAG: hypothetical protein GXP27_14290 [Planctomycetes bacterium]|nr:hypothetical protein [Planctomycetota bacterium]
MIVFQDSVDTNQFLPRDGTKTLTADWDAGSHQIRAETFYADAAQGVAPFVIVSTTKVANLNADLLDGLHATEFAQGIGAHLSAVRVATTADITLSGLQTIDGVSVQAGDRVLVKDDADPSSPGVANGIWVAASGAWSRADDMPAGASAAGHLVIVEEGTSQADTLWLCTNNSGSDVVGTNALSFSQISGGGGSVPLGNLTDVEITNVGENEVLAYDAAIGKWINQTATEAGLAAAAHYHAAADITTGSLALQRGGLGTDLSSWSGLIKVAAGSASQLKSEFAKTVAPTANDDASAGYSVGSQWFDVANDAVYFAVDVSAGAAVWRRVPANLDDLSDVEITGVTDNEILGYDAASGKWINQTAAELGLSGGGGSGDVTGPTSSTDNGIAKFDGTTGKVLQSSAVTIDDGTDKLHVKATAGALQSDSDAATITFDMDVADVHQVTLGGDRTLAVTNVSVGQRFLIRLTQDSTGGRTVTWWSGIRWPGGLVPSLTSTPNKTDVFGFLCTGPNSYDGFLLGQNL